MVAWEGNSPFPIRYEMEFSKLKYAQEWINVVPEFDKEKNLENVIFKLGDALVPNKDRFAKEYPVCFDCANIKDGCICYTAKNGSCSRGLRLLQAR